MVKGETEYMFVRQVVPRSFLALVPRLRPIGCDLSAATYRMSSHHFDPGAWFAERRQCVPSTFSSVSSNSARALSAVPLRAARRLPGQPRARRVSPGEQTYILSPFTIGARNGYIISPLSRLVPATGIFSLPFRDWCPLWVYFLPPFAIGACYGYILSPLSRLVPATDACGRDLSAWRRGSCRRAKQGVAFARSAAAAQMHGRGPEGG
eukprot:1188093-Prorocentrum_minimum.AAC.1